jgi:hypothetical protein
MKTIAGGYVLAGIILCLGAYASIRPGGTEGTRLLHSAYVGAVLLTVLTSAAWAHRRGFPLRNGEGDFSLTNLLRVLLGSAVAWIAVLIAAGPIALIIVNIFKR